MNRASTPRQVIRRTIIFIMFLIFPIIINFLSPYLIIDGAFNGILNGSALVFGMLFLSSIFLGRAWCGWVCPGAGLQETAMFIQDKKANQKGNWIKYLIWILWIAAIISGFIAAGGISSVQPLYMTETGISVTELRGYILYLFVTGLILTLALTTGKRGFCHYGCWMAPFMIIGRKLRNLLKTPALKLQSEPEKCIDCQSCSRACPMSLDVHTMVKNPNMEHSECILCGNCVDTCAKKVIAYKFSKG